MRPPVEDINDARRAGARRSMGAMRKFGGCKARGAAGRVRHRGSEVVHHCVRAARAWVGCIPRVSSNPRGPPGLTDRRGRTRRGTSGKCKSQLANSAKEIPGVRLTGPERFRRHFPVRCQGPPCRSMKHFSLGSPAVRVRESYQICHYRLVTPPLSANIREKKVRIATRRHAGLPARTYGWPSRAVGCPPRPRKDFARTTRSELLTRGYAEGIETVVSGAMFQYTCHSRVA